MCGIIGYTGSQRSVPILIDGLRTLEYRGYDSAGIAVRQGDGISIVKAKGRLDRLASLLDSRADLTGGCGIGHTRWATHGEPSDRNSHPHATERLALVHNGIIENYAELEEMLRLQGYTFDSETDTERAAKLVDLYYRETSDPVKAIFKAAALIRGSYAFGVIYADIPNKIYAMRRDSPLIVAQSKDGGLIASDIPAILRHTHSYYRLQEGVVAELNGECVKFYDSNLHSIDQPAEQVDWDVEQAQKGGYPHFMLKEIFEEPDSLRKTIAPRIVDGLPHFGVEQLDGDFFARFEGIHIIACGTAMHAGIIGKSIIEKLARVPVNVEIASEFRYRDPILRKNDLVILISQSGETADTLAALRHAKAQGIYTLAIVNVIGSSVAREADSVIYTWAGPEIAVASTKAYSVQLSILYLFALRLALLEGTMTEDEVRAVCARMLEEIPAAVEKAIAMSDRVRDIARAYMNAEHLFYIGRNVDYDLCVEGSLKLKEISYIHSEAYASGELKHGTISLITDGVPVIALTTISHVCEKTISGIREVISRGARVLSICSESLADKYQIPYSDQLIVPEVDELLSPFPTVTLLQLFAYHVSALKGYDVDKPRNLAKSVTVE
ncbi:MAG: glutamine--fructose-6-phosphate transaminase (isomerizing) [Clostridia bacterium]|nr:glutamine--fructose-6-phosphate transaminase (isomerizing) [Clostridia bacterium]